MQLERFDARSSCYKLLARDGFLRLVNQSFVPGDVGVDVEFAKASAANCEAQLSRQLYAVALNEPPFTHLAMCLPTVCTASSVDVHPYITDLFRLRRLLDTRAANLTRDILDFKQVAFGVHEHSCLGQMCKPVYRRVREKLWSVARWPGFLQPADPRFRCGMMGRVLRSLNARLEKNCETAWVHGFRPSLARFRLRADPFRGLVRAKDPLAGRQPDLLVAVLCATHEVAYRDAVRASWGKLRLPHGTGATTFDYKFFIGTEGLALSARDSLRQEAGQFGDLVLVRMADSYANLTLKFLYVLDYARSVVRPRFLMRLNVNQRMQPRRFLKFISAHPDGVVDSHYPRGFLWGGRGCIMPRIFDEMSCGTLPLNFMKGSLVDFSLVPYPQGNWLASKMAYEHLWAAFDSLFVGQKRPLVPDGFCEDCFVGYLAALAGVPVLEFSPDGHRLWYGDNCSSGLTLFDEPAEDLARPRRGCT